MWEQTDVLHYCRHAPLHTRCLICNHCMSYIQAVVACRAYTSFGNFSTNPCTRITASAIPRSPRRSPPNGHARYAPRSSRDWRPCPPIDGQRSRHAPVCLYSNRQPDDLSAWQGQGRSPCRPPASLAPHFGADAFRCECTLGMHTACSDDSASCGCVSLG